MPSHWFILIGFGFSQQQSELIFLSWNNSAPFVPVFYCLIPFILFYCQSFVSLGLQVISNPVGCYNEAFIPQLPWFPCPFGQEPGLLSDTALTPSLPALPPAPGRPRRIEALAWRGPGPQRGSEPTWALSTERPVTGAWVWWGSGNTFWPHCWNRILFKSSSQSSAVSLGGKSLKLCVSSPVGTELCYRYSSAVLNYLDQSRYDSSGRKIMFSGVGGNPFNLHFFEIE